MKDLLLLGSPFQRFPVPAPFVTSYKGLAYIAKFGIHSLQNPTAPENSLACLWPLGSGRLQITSFLSVPGWLRTPVGSEIPRRRRTPSDSKSQVRYLPSADLSFLPGHLIPTVLQSIPIKVPAVGRFELSSWTPNTHSPPGSGRLQMTCLLSVPGLRSDTCWTVNPK
uniref:cDNA FLJ25694 fis, clone TST04471 n=1 Tax=Homo sapiens TaxID=9606 RepID=Q8N7F4_HUMAN|nr:unnamed protein product [Homo sapiens]